MISWFGSSRVNIQIQQSRLNSLVILTAHFVRFCHFTLKDLTENESKQIQESRKIMTNHLVKPKVMTPYKRRLF